MMKRVAAVSAVLCLTVSALVQTAGAASYFPRYSGGSGSIAIALDSLGIDSSYSNRTDIASANGIGNYRGTAEQNIQMLELLRQGVLIDPDGDDAVSWFFPAYSGNSVSIVTALNSLGIESGFQYRGQIATANGIVSYSGTAAQNTVLLGLLRQGRLICPDADLLYSGLVAANLSRVSFIRQDTNTCKATAAAMAVNIIRGMDRYSTSDMIYSGVLCRSLDGDVYAGSDGQSYRTTYKLDSYAGSLAELEAAVDEALSNGLPIVAAVHSNHTRHHWIVIVGRDSNGDYLAVDPAGNGSGSMESQVRSMSGMGYSFGLTDYAQPHYGYISFQQC